jgi:putative aldouronate transport system permease protein
MKRTAGDKAFVATNYVLILVFTILVVYPFLWCVILSFNDGKDAQRGGIYLWPRVFTLDNYRYVFSNADVLIAARTSILRTAAGTVGSIFVTSIFAYAASKKDLVFRRAYMLLGLVTMYFGGGLIPYVLVIRMLGLYNNFLVYVIPNLFAMFNALVFVAFFQTIPASLEESAKLDGANDFLIFLRIIVPVSKPVFATIALFVAVGQWNSWFDNMLFVREKELQTLSYFLTKMVSAQRFVDEVMTKFQTGVGRSAAGMTSTSLMLATMVVTAFPIIVLYPFLQKHFAKGVMIGSIKG